MNSKLILIVGAFFLVSLVQQATSKGSKNLCLVKGNFSFFLSFCLFLFLSYFQTVFLSVSLSFPLSFIISLSQIFLFSYFFKGYYCSYEFNQVIRQWFTKSAPECLYLCKTLKGEFFLIE